MSIAARAIAVASLALVAANAQVRLGGGGATVRIFNNDRAVLEAGDPRNDLPCTVNHEKPLLGFDLRFHAGYDVAIPLKELAGREDMLTILFRVSKEDQKDDPTYFIQKIRVPMIEDDARGDAYLQGQFDLGEGRYHIDWLIRDRSERVCSSYWDVEAVLPAKDKQISLEVQAGAILPSETESFREEPPVERWAANESPLNVKVLVNFAPQNSRHATLQPLDLNALVSILRTISRDPRIGKFSITAFNMQEQKVVYRQDSADKIDFPAIGRALNHIKLGTIDLDRLGKKHGETEFLASLIRQEIGAETTRGKRHDAIIFAGPKALLQENVPADALRDMGDIDSSVFYMNYNLYPQAVPWKDSISHAVKYFKGMEFTISRPRDLWYAVSEMVSRTVKNRLSKRAQLEVGR